MHYKLYAWPPKILDDGRLSCFLPYVQEQERYDDYMEMREGMDLANVHFKESLISWASPDNPPWFAKAPVFWLCNFLLLSWPLRLILELNTAHVHYQVSQFYFSYFPFSLCDKYVMEKKQGVRVLATDFRFFPLLNLWVGLSCKTSCNFLCSYRKLFTQCENNEPN